jgi:hypothetical protein
MFREIKVNTIYFMFWWQAWALRNTPVKNGYVRVVYKGAKSEWKPVFANPDGSYTQYEITRWRRYGEVLREHYLLMKDKDAFDLL